MEKSVKFRLYTLSVIRGLQSASYAISIPFLSIYLYNVRGVPMTFVGLIVGVATIVGAMMRILGGRLSDLYPSDRVMKFGLYLRAGGFLGFSILIWLNGYPVLFSLFFLLNSAGNSFFTSASDLFVAKNFSEADRPFGYSVIRVGGNLGFAIGPAIGGFISRYSYGLTFFMSFLLQVICVFLVMYLVGSHSEDRYSNQNGKLSLAKLAEDKNFMVFIAGTFILSLLMGQLISTLSVFSKSRGLSNTQIGYLYSINGLMVVFFQIALIRIVDLVGYKRGLILGSVLYSIGYFLFTFAFNFWHFSIGVVILTLGEMLAMPLLTTVSSLMAPQDRRGLYIGFLGFTEGLAWAVAPMIGGALIDAFLKTPVFIWGTVSSFGIVSVLIFAKVKFK